MTSFALELAFVLVLPQAGLGEVRVSAKEAIPAQHSLQSLAAECSGTKYVVTVERRDGQRPVVKISAGKKALELTSGPLRDALASFGLTHSTWICDEKHAQLQTRALIVQKGAEPHIQAIFANFPAGDPSPQIVQSREAVSSQVSAGGTER